jgi:hypothetical protein
MSASYSLSWARGIVSKLREKHARGTEDVERYLGITDEDLANFLAHGDPMFAALRNLIHCSESWMEEHPEVGTATHLYTEIQLHFGVNIRERVDRGLARKRTLNTIKEQALREGG